MPKRKTTAPQDATCPRCKEKLAGRSVCFFCEAADAYDRTLALLAQPLALSKHQEAEWLTAQLVALCGADPDGIARTIGIKFTPEDPAWPQAMKLVGKSGEATNADSILLTRDHAQGPWSWLAKVRGNTLGATDMHVTHAGILQAFAGFEPGAAMLHPHSPPTGPATAGRAAFVAGPWTAQGYHWSRHDWYRHLPSHSSRSVWCASVSVIDDRKNSDEKLGTRSKWWVHNELTGDDYVRGEAETLLLAAHAANEALGTLGIEHDGLLPGQSRVRE
ncbi:MAG: hypothetical protein ACHREM_00020 [Polyangiales bacterium]